MAKEIKKDDEITSKPMSSAKLMVLATLTLFISYILFVKVNQMIFYPVGTVEEVGIEAFESNTCVKSRDDARIVKTSSLDTIYILEYTIETDKFSTDCYSELTDDMNAHKHKGAWLDFGIGKKAQYAVINWNEKTYKFTIPQPDAAKLVNDENAESLLTAYDKETSE